MLKLLLVWLAGVNLALLVLMGWDKAAAIRGSRRVPEQTLLALAVIGGSSGGILGMLLFRHKTKKSAFALGFPIIFLCQAALAYVIWLNK